MAKDRVTALRLKDKALPPPPTGKYPAKTHARKVAAWIASNAATLPNGTNGDAPSAASGGVIYLEAQKTHMKEDDDQEAPFRQRRAFYYLSGCNLADSYLVYDIDRDHLTLFIPPIDADDVIWSGLPELPKDAVLKYDIDACLTTPELNDFLASPSFTKSQVYTIPEQVSSTTNFKSFSTKISTILRKAIDTCRVTKSPHEIALIRHANIISSSAHLNVMRVISSATTEAEAMGAFVGSCISNGGREQAYGCICASGTSAATLHYVHNDLPTSDKLNMLIDAGCEYSNYCADITRTYPLNGTFTTESRAIYDLVSRMQDECMTLIRPGVQWEDVHVQAHKTAIAGLQDLGILRAEFGQEELFSSRVSTVFLPHGLGHYLGMDTHDTGGNADYADPDPMFRYLRIRGQLPEDCVVTNEPGIYFCRFIVEPALKDEKLGKYIDADVLERYWDVGGVRIEDDIWVRKGGCENLTTVTKDVDVIASIIKGDEA